MATSESRKVTAGLAVLALCTLALTTATSTSAWADDLAEKAEAPLSLSDQRIHEQELRTFLSNTPPPSPALRAGGVDAQNDYWEAQAAWWDSVPWESVAGQWGCTVGETSVSFNSPMPLER